MFFFRYVEGPATGLEQTSVQLETKLKLPGSGTELKLGRQQVQKLTEQAQLTAVNLKGCCIVLSMGKVNAEEFLQCQGAIRDYEDHARVVTERVDAATSAQKAGDSERFQAAVAGIGQTLANKARQAQEVKERIPTGELRMQTVPTKGAKPLEACFDVYHEQDIDGNRVKVDRQCTKTARFTLNAGRYYVYSWVGNANGSGEFDVSPGKLSNHRLLLATQ